MEEENFAVDATGHEAVAGDPHGADDDGLGRALALRLGEDLLKAQNAGKRTENTISKPFSQNFETKN